MAIDVNTSKFPKYAAVVTPSDATVFTEPSTVFVGTGGNVAVVPWGGSTPVIFTMASSTVVPVLVKQVMSTDTTAADMVRVYGDA